MKITAAFRIYAAFGISGAVRITRPVIFCRGLQIL